MIWTKAVGRVDDRDGDGGLELGAQLDELLGFYSIRGREDCVGGQEDDLGDEDEVSSALAVEDGVLV